MNASTGIVVVLILGGIILMAVLAWALIRAADRSRRRHRLSSTRAMVTVSPSRATSTSVAGRQPTTDDPLAALLGLAAVAVFGILAFKGLQKGVSFLKGLDWESLDPVLREAISRFSADITGIRDNNARLEKAENLPLVGDKISVEQAAMLTSATLEASLKILCQRHGVPLDSEPAEGMAGIASVMLTRGIVSPDECRDIRRYAATVRNKVMHGDFDALRKEDVREQIEFTRAFFRLHALT